MIKIGPVILRERTTRNMTQQQLADFLNVTKATISKWEKGGSYPDITMLPILASFFNMSIDELLNAKRTLDKNAIRKWYARFAEQFSEESFEVVFVDVEKMIKLYYDDDNFLLQMSILLLNHAEFSPNSKDTLKMIISTLKRAEEITRDVWIQRQINVMVAIASLYMEQPEVALERLKGSVHPALGEEMILAQAYEAVGQTGEAKQVLQVLIYQQLLGIIGSGPFYLKLMLDQEEQFLETVRRIEVLIDLFDVEQLHPNVSLQFYFAVAQFAALKEDENLCEQHLSQYGRIALNDFLPLELKGDAYFDRLDGWFERLDLGSAPLRGETIIRESLIQTLEHPAFQQYENSDWLIELKEKLEFKLGDAYE